ncbi:MAG TPA: response regulator [Opitutaceae bacterium]|nr:response regulator [Opitutaceae bacterium]
MKRILVIDDDQFVLKVYQSKFEAEGLHAEVAADPISALTQVRKSVPDLILLDLMLPGMNGVDLLKQIRTIPGAEGVPVLVFTHSYDSALIEQAKTSGADVVLNKNSVSPNRLMEMVRHALAQGRRHALPGAAEATEAKQRDAASAGPEKQFVRGDLRVTMSNQAQAIEGRLREMVQTFTAAPDGTQRMGALAQLNNLLGDIIHDAVDSDLFDITMMGRALSRMIVDLEQHPEEISLGTVRSFGVAVITIANLYRRIGSAPHEHELPGLAVVVIANPQAGRLIAEAFIEVGFPAVSFSTTEAAGPFVAENPANIIICSDQWTDTTGEEFFLRCSSADGRRNLRSLYLSQSVMPAHHTVAADTPPTLYLPYTAEEVVVNALARFYHRR